MSNEDKKYRKLMDMIDDINPYSTYLSDSTLSVVDEWIDTGSLALNAIISGSMYKGVPVGRITQFAGPSMTGKTFFVQKIIANAQKMGKYVMVFDSENAITPEDSIKFGVDPTNVKYITALTVENTRNAVNKFLKGVADSGELGKFVIIMDNIASMETELSESRMEKESVAVDMGTQARAIKALLKTCTKWSAITKTTIVFTNEIYDNPNQMYPSIEKNIAGGRSTIYKPSVTVQLSRTPGKADDAATGDTQLAAGQKKYSGVFLTCLTVKNRFVKQYLEAELYLSFNNGLNRFYGLNNIMRSLGVTVLDGKTYKDWNGESLGYYKNWKDDKEVWKKLLPELEKRIQTEWKYSSEEMPFEDEDELDDTPEVEETPLEKLKKAKNKVSTKLDKIEEQKEIKGCIGLAGMDNDE